MYVYPSAAHLAVAYAFACERFHVGSNGRVAVVVKFHGGGPEKYPTTGDQLQGYDAPTVPTDTEQTSTSNIAAIKILFIAQSSIDKHYAYQWLLYFSIEKEGGGEIIHRCPAQSPDCRPSARQSLLRDLLLWIPYPRSHLRNRRR